MISTIIIILLICLLATETLLIWALVTRSRSNNYLAEQLINEQQKTINLQNEYINNLEKSMILNSNNVLKN